MLYLKILKIVGGGVVGDRSFTLKMCAGEYCRDEIGLRRERMISANILSGVFVWSIGDSR